MCLKTKGLHQGKKDSSGLHSVDRYKHRKMTSMKVGNSEYPSGTQDQV